MKLFEVLNIPRGETTILQAEGKDYKRGLRVKLLEDGGYEAEYWYKDSSKAYPVEAKVDGKSIKKDAKNINIIFHPELEK